MFSAASKSVSSGGYQISNSLRFRASASAYLNRTPSVTGNQQKFTWSGWVKRGALVNGNVFVAGVSGSARFEFNFYNNAISVGVNNGSWVVDLLSAAVFRDPSAWYHLVLAVDTTQATSTNRVIVYVNSVRQTMTGTFPSQNLNTFVNTTIEHDIGQSQGGGGSFFDGYMAEVNFIDGQALTPSSFGSINATTGVWQPARYTGSYGTNGFYLKFSGASQATYAGSLNGSSQYLTIPTSSPLQFGTGDFTVECWTNLTSRASNFPCVFGNYNSFSAGALSLFAGHASASTTQYQVAVNGSGFPNIQSSVSVTYNKWVHLAVVRNSGTITLYVNGVSNGTFNASGVSLNGVGSNWAIGTTLDSVSSGYLNGFVSNFRIVKGTAVYTSNFTPPTSPLTAISGTSLLTLQNSSIVDNSTNAFTITNNGSVTTSTATPWGLLGLGLDSSGNGNNWTTNNISLTAGSTYDWMIDSPTSFAGSSYGVGNYCVMNAVSIGSDCTLSDGNLGVAYGSNSGIKSTMATIGMSSGKWYCEFSITGGSSPSPAIGISSKASASDMPEYIGYTANGWGYYIDGTKRNNAVGGGSSAYGATWTTGDIIGIAFDADAGSLTFYKNNTSQGVAFTGLTSGPYYFGVGDGSNSATFTSWFNFGQRPFSYTPPTGFKSLCTQNLPAPAIYNGANHMAATTYTGNGATQSISNAVNSVSFQPGLVWIKKRDTSGQDHVLQDSVRGFLSSTKLSSSSTAAENNTGGGATDPQWGYVSSVSSSGINITVGSGTGDQVNKTSGTYIGWQWKAGGTAVTNTSGSITSQVSANPTAGFSVVTYTGNGVNGATVGHGLGVAPSMFIIKKRSSTSNWTVYHQSLSANGGVFLNLTDAYSADPTRFNNTAPTSTVFTLGSPFEGNTNGATLVAYCFAAIAGYSAFGSYTGNGSSVGPFIYTGFLPRFILIKSTSGPRDWIIWDTARNPYNIGTAGVLFPDTSGAEYSGGGAYAVSVVSNGFYLPVSTTNLNASGETMIYAAFASNPFQNSLAF